jgi:hypothetical protein
VGANPGGGAALVTGDENDMKTIRVALGSDDNENAFQQGIGLGDGMVFEIADPTTRNLIERRVVDIFRRFEAQKRYILRQGTIKWQEDSANQQFIMSFKYLNVESDEDKMFRQQFNRQRGTASEV